MADTTNGSISGSQASTSAHGQVAASGQASQDMSWQDNATYTNGLDNIGGSVLQIMASGDPNSSQGPGGGVGLCKISQLNSSGHAVARASIELKGLPLNSAIHAIGDTNWVPGRLNFNGMLAGQSGSFEIEISGNIKNISLSGIVSMTLSGPGNFSVSIPFAT